MMAVPIAAEPVDTKMQNQDSLMQAAAPPSLAYGLRPEYEMGDSPKGTEVRIIYNPAKNKSRS